MICQMGIDAKEKKKKKVGKGVENAIQMGERGSFIQRR